MPTAILAEDEPILRAQLQAKLAKLWPELEILASVEDGAAALEALEDRAPDFMFLDIQMPEMTGVEVAKHVGARAHVVFVTAYDQYAMDAFEAAAVDYLLKPVGEERLARCVARLQARVAGGARGGTGAAGGVAGGAASAGAVRGGSAGGEPDLPSLLARLQQRLDAVAAAPGRLRFLRASLGDVTRQIPVDEVLYFEARDKYVAVVTRDASALVRLSLSELLDGLDPEQFTQIHRSTVVRLDAIDTIRRDLTGRSWVHLREKVAGREVRLAVSRQFAARFRGM